MGVLGWALGTVVLDVWSLACTARARIDFYSMLTCIAWTAQLSEAECEVNWQVYGAKYNVLTIRYCNYHIYLSIRRGDYANSYWLYLYSSARSARCQPGLKFTTRLCYFSRVTRDIRAKTRCGLYRYTDYV